MAYVCSAAVLGVAMVLTYLVKEDLKRKNAEDKKEFTSRKGSKVSIGRSFAKKSRVASHYDPPKDTYKWLI